MRRLALGRRVRWGEADGDIREGGCKQKPLPKAGSPDQRESLRSDVQLPSYADGETEAWEGVWLVQGRQGRGVQGLKMGCGSPLTRVRYPALCRELCQQDPKGPHVGLDGEPAIEGSFGSRPLNGEFGTCRCKRSYRHHSHPHMTDEETEAQSRDRTSHSPWYPPRPCPPCRAVYSLSSMSLARPKSATLHTRFSPTRMLAARRSRWT